MGLSRQKFALIALYGLAALALVGAAVVFAVFKDELRRTEASITIVAEEQPSLESFDAPFSPPDEVGHEDEELPMPEDMLAEEVASDDDELPEEELAELDLENIPTEEWDVLDPIEPEVVANTRYIGQSRSARQRTATLVVITNFEKAKVTVNGVDYPAYGESGENEGLKVPAGGPHHVVVNFNGNEKLYEVFLRPNEERFLMIELTGFRGGAPVARPTPAPPTSSVKQKDAPADGLGRITVYSRPRGNVFIGGDDKGQATPGTIEVESGRHDVQVRYEDGEMSEKKVVRVREGSRIKLFFRQ